MEAGRRLGRIHPSLILPMSLFSDWGPEFSTPPTNLHQAIGQGSKSLQLL